MNIKDLYKVNGSESELGMIWEPEDEEVGRFRTGLRRPQQPRRVSPRPGRPRPKQPVRRPIPRRRRRRPLPINFRSPDFTQPEPQSQGSEYVRWVQTMLNQALNLRLPVHGMLDVQTRSAVRSFQEKNGLPVTGIVGPDTERALMGTKDGQAPASGTAKSEEPAAPPSEPGTNAPTEPASTPPGAEFEYEWERAADGSSPDYIKWVQHSLNQIMGLRLAVDGKLGPQTRSAIRSFQQKQRLGESGVPNPPTEAALRNALAKSTTPAMQPPRSQPAVGQEKIFFGLDYFFYDKNTNPNWARAKEQGPISFAIIQANWGLWENSNFQRDWRNMKEAGIVRGAYLFLRFPHPKYNMKAPDPVSQAKAFINTLPLRNIDKSDLPPALDVEFPGDKRYPNRTGRELTGMTKEQLLDGVRAAWKILKEYYGVAPIIYTSARVWQEDLQNLRAPDLVESPLWLAKPWPYRLYHPAILNPTILARFQPKVPPTWGDATNWWIYQYQGDANATALPGFRQVDMNLFRTMQRSARGDRVKWVQRRLGIAQSGQFDNSMEGILRAFQKSKGLASNGIIDPRTFAYLCWSNP